MHAWKRLLDKVHLVAQEDRSITVSSREVLEIFSMQPVKINVNYNCRQQVMFTVISQFPEWKSVKDNSTRSLFQIKSSCREHAQPNNNSDFDHFIVILCPVSIISDQNIIAPNR